MHTYILTRFSVFDPEFKGFVMTRTMAPEAYRSCLYSPARLDFKFDVFEKVTLPAVVNQTCKNYTWLIYTSSSLPALFRERLFALTANHKQVRVIEVDSMGEFFRDINKQVVHEDYATVRLDDDDGLCLNFLEALNFHKDRKGMVISFPNGIEFKMVAGEVVFGKKIIYKKIALGLAGINVNIFRAGNHIEADEKYPVVYDEMPGAYSLCCSEHSDLKHDWHEVTFHRFWLGRFTVRDDGSAELLARDRLQAAGRVIPKSAIAGLTDRQRDIAFFHQGFVRPAITAIGQIVEGSPIGPDDSLFWQFPARTEQAAWIVHADLRQSLFADNVMHVYLGLPWATWIDKGRRAAWGDSGPLPMQQQLQRVGVYLSGQRHALAELGVELRVHTVCQHVDWADLTPAWQKLGVTDLWLSHCPGRPVPGFEVHPWRLFAPNVEDLARRQGLRIGVDPAQKPLLASFIGTHASHYLCDMRLRLNGLTGEPGMHIRLTEQWHFEQSVYGQQMWGSAVAAVAERAAAVDDGVAEYNRVLSDSMFSLCPAGAGANTLRLWESLAVGAVPVLLGSPSNQPLLPRGGTLLPVDWDAIVLRVPDDQVHDLPAVLRRVPLDEVRRRQRLGMQAFEGVCAQRCF